MRYPGFLDCQEPGFFINRRELFRTPTVLIRIFEHFVFVPDFDKAKNILDLCEKRKDAVGICRQLFEKREFFSCNLEGKSV